MLKFILLIFEVAVNYGKIFWVRYILGGEGI